MELEEGQDIRRVEEKGTHGNVLPHIVPANSLRSALLWSRAIGRSL